MDVSPTAFEILTHLAQK